MTDFVPFNITLILTVASFLLMRNKKHVEPEDKTNNIISSVVFLIIEYYLCISGHTDIAWLLLLLPIILTFLLVIELGYLLNKN